MKPLRLELEAFGPFLDSKSVDLRALAQSSFFLIHGPTGSGKTSLFDAMSFALYGESTGDERDGSSLRSQHAPLKTATRVVLDFSLGTQNYRVSRKLRPVIPKKTANKAEPVSKLKLEPSAELSLLKQEGEHWIEAQSLGVGASEVTQKCQELIGLDAKQFRKVIILPQGKFREFLAANSGERERILEALFRTTAIKKFQDRMKADAEAEQKEVLRLQQELSGLLSSQSATELSQIDELQGTLQEEVENLRSNLAPIEATLSQAEVALKTAEEVAKTFTLRDEALQRLEALQQKTGEIPVQKEKLVRAERAQRVAPFQARAHAIRAQVSALVARLPQLRETLTTARKREELAQAAAHDAAAQEKRRPQLQAEQQKTEDAIQRVSQLTELEKELTPQREAAAQTQKKINESSTRIQALKAEAPLLSEQLREAERSQSEIPLHELEEKQIHEKLALLEKHRQSQLRVEELRNKLKRFRDAKAAISKEVDQTRARFFEQEDLFYSQQAAVLARDLKPGAPCRVCGSCEHPAPASPTEGLEHPLSREELLNLKNQLEALQERERKGAEHCLQASTEVEQAELQKNDLEESLAKQGLNFQEDPVSRLLATQRVVIEKVKALRSQALQVDPLQKRISSLTLDTHQAELNQKQLLESHTTLLQSVSALEGQAAALRATFDPQGLVSGSITPNALLVRLQELQKELQHLDENSARAREESLRSATATAQAESTLKEVEAQERESLEQQKLHEQALLQELHVQQFKSEAELIEASLPAAESERIGREIARQEEELSETRGQIDWLNGQIGHQSRPELSDLKRAVLLAKEARDGAQRNLAALEQKQRTLGELLSKAGALVAELKKAEARYAALGLLSDVANGQRPGQRLSFQRYVLGIYFDDVLAIASTRLLSMSRGRYGLKRSQTVMDGRSVIGLDLLIEDHWQGTERLPSTLSGGEGFLASLALALALSESVQSEAGGIRLDSIFIDEGFGTLDGELLSLVLKTLTDLQIGGRMVGVISHVDTLKSVIPAQIELRPQPQGSDILIRNY